MSIIKRTLPFLTAITLTILSIQCPANSSLAAPGHPEQKEVKKQLIQAQSLLDANQKDKAEILLNDLVHTYPDSTEAKLLHSVALYDQGRFHAAQDILTVLTTQDNCSEKSWLYLARTYQKIGKLQNSIDAYNQYISKIPKNSEDLDKYKTLVMLLQDQLKQQTQNRAQKNTQGNYVADVSNQGIFRWPEKSMPIKVYIKPPEGVKGYRYDFDESIRDAFDQWQMRTNGLIKFEIIEDPEQANFKVVWTDDLKSKPFTAEMGHAQLQSDENGISQVEVDLLTVDPFKEGPVGKRLMRNVCLHEVGHALGLQGHSPYKDDIMYPQLNLQDGISDRDLNTLLIIYSKDATAKILDATPTIKQNTEKRKAAILSIEGSKLAVTGKYEEAYLLLKQAVKLEPNRKIVKQNLAAITNNLAIKQENPQEAIKLAHESLFYVDSENTRENLNIFLARLKIDPKSFEQRLKLSNQCKKNNDKIGALVELKEALKIKADQSVKERLGELEREIRQGQSDQN